MHSNSRSKARKLSGTWKWIGASKSEVQNPDGLLVTVELESSVRPVRVKIQTLLSGGPVMVRWLEVQEYWAAPDRHLECFAVVRATLAHSQLRGKTSSGF